MTLAFSLAAIARLADPKAVFEDAAEWSRYVGVLDHDRRGVERVVSEHGLRQDYELDGLDVWLQMEGVGEETDTRRRVYVGATDEDERVSTFLDWEFLPVTEAAEAAGWELVTAE